jgi:hypothetical protein
MEIIFARIWWGVIIILSALFLIITGILKANFPFFRIVMAAFIIYVGIRLIGGSYTSKNTIDGADKETTVFAYHSVFSSSIESGEKFNVIFGKQIIDLHDIDPPPPKNIELEINAVFSRQKIRISPSQNIRIDLSSAISLTEFPNGNSIALGEYIYNPAHYDPDSNSINIKVNAAFSSLTIEQF